MQNYMPYGVEFDSKVLNDVRDLNKKIDEEMEKPNADKDKLMKLRMQRLYRGIELNTGYYNNNYRAMYPY